MNSEELSEADHRSLLRLARGPGGQQAAVTDHDVLRRHFRFAWREGEEDESAWGARMAKRYVQKLFKEFALCDLSQWRTGRVGLRWRIEREVIEGKGQFICGNLACQAREGLASYELNFRYREAGEVKNELVKVRLCPDCKVLLQRSNEMKGSASSRGVGSSSSSRATSSSQGQVKEERKRERKEEGRGSNEPEDRKRSKASSAPQQPQIKPESASVRREGAVPPPPAALSEEELRRRKEAEKRGKEIDDLIQDILDGKEEK